MVLSSESEANPSYLKLWYKTAFERSEKSKVTFIENEGKIETGCKASYSQDEALIRDMLGHPPFSVGLRYALSGPELDRDAK